MSSGTRLRIITAGFLIPAVVLAVWFAPQWLVAALAWGVAVIALREFFALGERIGLRAYHFWTYVAALAIFAQQWAQQWHGAQLTVPSEMRGLLDRPAFPRCSLEFVLFVFLLGAAGIALGSRRPANEMFSSVSVSAAGLIVVALPFSAVVRLNAVPEFGHKLLLFTLFLVWAGDTAGYFGGRFLGRVKLSPQLSPNKTWEGAAANLLGALLVAFLFSHWMKIGLLHMLGMAFVGSVIGQAGDIFESGFKRSAGAKDSGAILPGHGGVLDRIDALIFAAPAVWYYFQWFVMGKL